MRAIFIQVAEQQELGSLSTIEVKLWSHVWEITGGISYTAQGAQITPTPLFFIFFIFLFLCLFLG